MNKTAIMVIFSIISFVTAIAYGQEIVCMGYEWSHGFSPYEFIHLYIDYDGSGICNYKTNGGENVLTSFKLDNDYLDSLKSDFMRIDRNEPLQAITPTCIDCGVTRVFFTVASDSIPGHIDTIECRNTSIAPAIQKFEHLFSGEAILHGLKVYSALDGDRDSVKWFMVDNLLAKLAQTGSLKKMHQYQRATEYLDKIVRNKTWQSRRRVWAMDCLSREWHWRYFGLKISAAFSQKAFREGESIPMTVTLINISDKELSLRKDWDGDLWIGGAAGEYDHDRNLPWSASSSRDCIDLNSGDTIKIDVMNFAEKTNLSKGIHWIVISYTNAYYADGCDNGDLPISITSDSVQIEIY